MIMAVDVPACTVTWTRNGAAVKAQQHFKQLQDTSIRWVPYIFLYYGGSVNNLFNYLFNNRASHVSVSLLEETWT